MRLLATLGALIISGIVSASPLHNIVVFGDSLSDNGNLYEYMNHQLPQSPPYFEGRFSNGPVWIEHLVASYFPKDPNAHLEDYAIGGSGISEDEEDDEVLFTLRRQLKAYLLAHDNKASEDALYVVWIGANNYLGMPDDMDHTLRIVNEGIADTLQKLVNAGAKHILIFNLPDLGKTPAAIEFGALDMFTYFSAQHNDILLKTVNDFKQSAPDVEWLFFDFNYMFNYVMEHGEEFGFTNVTDTCSNREVIESGKKSLLDMVAHTKPNNNNACDGYVFFDLVHPTGVAHRLIAEHIHKVLDAAGVVFSE